MRSVPRIPRHLIYATTLRIGVISLTLLTGVAVGMPEHPAAAAPLHQGAWITPAAKENSNIVETRFRGGGMGVRRGGAVGVRGRGGAAWRGGGAVVRRGGAGVYRGGAVVRRGGAVAWRRPGGYWWPAGGAIAAGAAIGVVTAATAAAWAGAPPAPGYCWYYTDPAGFLGRVSVERSREVVDNAGRRCQAAPRTCWRFAAA
jgi:hypothetical protein